MDPSRIFATVAANTRSARALTTFALILSARLVAAQSDDKLPPRAPSREPSDSAAPYPQLTLREVIERALAVSPIVASGVGSLKDAHAFERVARGTYLPTIAVGSTATSTGQSTGSRSGSGSSAGVGRVDTTRAGSNASSVSNFATIGLGATIDVFTGGRRRALKDEARAGVRGATSTLDSARYAARFHAESTFYEVIRARDLVQVAQSGLTEADLLVRYTRDMFRAGTVTKSDLLRAQLQSVTLQTQLFAAKDTLLAAVYALGWLTGANGPVGAMSDSASEAIRPLSLDDTAVVRVAVESSPMVVGTIETLAIRQAALRSARALYSPTITASAIYNKATISTLPGTASGNGLTTATGAVPAIAGRPGWAVSLGTVYPVFNGYQREDSVARAQAALFVAQSIANDAVRLARSTAARLLSTLHTSSATIALDVEAVRSAREDLRVQLARYRAGISTMLDVLTSQLALDQAGYNLAQARNRYHTSRAALEALIGRRL